MASGARRLLTGIPMLGISLTVLALGGAACSPHDHSLTANSAPTTSATTTATSTAVVNSSTTVPRPSTTVPRRSTTVPRPSEPASSLVAHLKADTPGYAAPGGKATRTVPAAWYGYQSILPVVATRPGWLDVRLAQRPNGSTAWIAASAATLSTTRYYIVVNLATEHLKVFFRGHPLYDFPAGIGAPDDPTVTGQYFVAMKTPPPDAGYGPFVLATSAHSDAIQDWEGLGDAIIAIHGPITSYDDQLIGTTGAAISHGCIRLHDNDLADLADVPAGTPIRIVN